MRSALTILFALLLQAGGQPINIPIPNPSFELGYHQSLSQDLGISPKQLQEIPGQPGYYREGFYTLSFTVVNHFPAYPGYWAMQIDFGTQELCDESGVGTAGITQVSKICPVSGYIVADQALPSGGPVQGASNLILTSTADPGNWPAWPVKFDNVSLTFTPTN